ncbi:hypothetical protein QQP08_009505 [Theobroma cacao]|nr:hypothetical protein QQP08_009505 [Theobroma cacao]
MCLPDDPNHYVLLENEARTSTFAAGCPLSMVDGPSRSSSKSSYLAFTQTLACDSLSQRTRPFSTTID